MLTYDSTDTNGTRHLSYLTGSTSNTCFPSDTPNGLILLDTECIRNASMSLAPYSTMFGPTAIMHGLAFGEQTKTSTHPT